MYAIYCLSFALKPRKQSNFRLTCTSLAYSLCFTNISQHDQTKPPNTFELGSIKMVYLFGVLLAIYFSIPTDRRSRLFFSDSSFESTENFVKHLGSLCRIRNNICLFYLFMLFGESVFSLYLVLVRFYCHNHQ